MPDDDAVDYDREYRMLRRFLGKQAGFQFGLGVIDDERDRAELIDRLAADLAADGVDLIRVDLRTLPEDTILLKALMDALAAHPAAAGRRRAISVVGLERHLDYKHGGSRPMPTDLLPTANFQRDAFPARCPVPMVLWGGTPAQRAIGHTAPDLWHWRTGSFDLRRERAASPTDALDRAIPRPAEEWQTLDKDSQERRRALLRALLDEDDPDPQGEAADRRIRLLIEYADTTRHLGDMADSRTAAEEALRLARARGADRAIAAAWDRLANVLVLNDPDEALRIRRDEVLPVWDRLGDAREKAVMLGRIADILHARGRIDEALRILQDEVRPAFDRLGDARAKAVALGKIADILHARGQLDEALRIRQEEELPVYDRLGDARSKAVTLGRIADILYARGQSDEALRILQDEALPVFDRLGDARSKAVTLGRIADILHARGQRDEALRIRQKEQLPVYDRLGDARAKAVTEWKIAIALMERDPEAHRAEVLRLLCGAQAAFRRMGLPEADRVQTWLDGFGLSCDGADAPDSLSPPGRGSG